MTTPADPGPSPAAEPPDGGPYGSATVGTPTAGARTDQPTAGNRTGQPAAPLRPERPRWRETLGLLLRNPTAAIAAGWILLMVVVALLDDQLAPQTANEISVADRLQAPSLEHPFGTDDLGRDVLSRVVLGATVSLRVGLIAVSISLVVGTLIGLLAGFYGKWVDDALMRFMDMLFAFPAVLLAISIVAILGPGLTNTTIAIGIVYIPIFARVTRSSVLSVREEVYVRASRSVGSSDLRLLFRHVLPNAAPPIIVQTSVSLAFAVLSEAALSFLGLGTQPPDPSWGLMLSEGRGYIELAWWIAVFPGLAIFLLVLSFNLLGDGLRDVLDPRQRTAMSGGRQ
ncbi:ABC transporter permease [Modestobacter roseus]|uniref:Peptide/nickel transport system permease protein n=1 Tax=Modestobacter roseus TaxID=1181884 RepID=A0A562IW80_9ACTN|nr:ABC transporter permease [Modestobacter roseus]MQA33363.1 ABC transporter permease subunit [Modestobacter roseus]TWH75279.1 peptide/nickel transport system permease protein [Modestobacter roseus]